MYNVTLRHIHVIILVVEKQQVLQNLCVFAVLVIQHAMRMRHIILFVTGLPVYAIFFHVTWQMAQFFFLGGGGGWYFPL